MVSSFTTWYGIHISTLTHTIYVRFVIGLDSSIAKRTNKVNHQRRLRVSAVASPSMDNRMRDKYGMTGKPALETSIVLYICVFFWSTFHIRQWTLRNCVSSPGEAGGWSPDVCVMASFVCVEMWPNCDFPPSTVRRIGFCKYCFGAYQATLCRRRLCRTRSPNQSDRNGARIVWPAIYISWTRNVRDKTGLASHRCRHT